MAKCKDLTGLVIKGLSFVQLYGYTVFIQFLW